MCSDKTTEILPPTLCEECDFTTESKIILNEHIENIQYSDFWLVGSKRRKRDNDIESCNKKNEEEEEMSLSRRGDQRILETRKHEDKEEE